MKKLSRWLYNSSIFLCSLYAWTQDHKCILKTLQFGSGIKAEGCEFTQYLFYIEDNFLLLRGYRIRT